MPERQHSIPDFRPQEIWKDVPGFEGLYQASSEGRVRRLLIMRPQARSNHGYDTIGIYKNLRRTMASIHSLVAAAFLGPKPEGYFVNHLDGNKKNNRDGNLEYVTHQENMKHAAAMGFMKRGAQLREKRYGHCWKQRKLSEDQVRQIRKCALIESWTAIARRVGVSRTCIFYIMSGKTYRNVE